MHRHLFMPVSTLAFALACAAGPNPDPAFPPQPFVPALSPSEEAETIQLPDGYRLELVLAEPDVREPVAISFDGNGRLYVAEMRTYMQNIDGAGEHDRTSVVSRHESSRADGVYDRHTIFRDQLLLPRLLLTLDERVLIGETDTSDIHFHSDTNRDGIADTKELFFAGGPRGGNMEHQPSGILWAMDNWLYTTYNAYRLRLGKNGAIKEATHPNGGQWGVAQDDHGKVWWSNGGGEKGLWHFQTHVTYGAFDLPGQFPPDFLTVYPLVGLADVQGGTGRFRAEDKTLNHFTASCGQEIFRGDRLPADMRGDALICEPVGRLIRRAGVSVVEGMTVISNRYPQSEFIRSTDRYFRPVNLATGPDGCLYIVDMYRGIIQEGNWVKEGSYLRKVVQQHGLDQVAGRGRIWRLVHRDFKPGPQPRMLEETPAQLVEHLRHPNGWWRDTAQKLLVLRGDKSVGSALVEMAGKDRSPLARIHALWTLEGLDLLDATLVRGALADADPDVRAAGIRVAESLYKKGDVSLQADITTLLQDASPVVAIQAIATARLLNWNGWETAAGMAVMTAKATGVRAIGKELLAREQQIAGSFSPAERARLQKGEAIYKELCFACHGFDGKGMALQGTTPGKTMAPPLAGSPTVTGSADALPLVLLHGMSGPIGGKTYEAQMVSMAGNNDEWIANIASYVRNAFGNSGSFIDPKRVAVLRKATSQRNQPWTQESLAATQPGCVAADADWKVTASPNAGSARKAIDGNRSTRFDTGTSQTPGQWFQLDLPAETTLCGLRLDAGNSRNDYPRGFKVELSSDGATWRMASEGKGEGAVTEILFAPAQARHVRITQTGAVNGLFWSIHELQLIRPPVAPLAGI